MCSCEWDWTCAACLNSRRDPAYLDTDDHEQPEPEPVRLSEYEVRDA